MTDIVAELGGACQDDAVRAAGTADTVGGKQPRWVAAPGSTEALAAVLRLCAQRGLAVVARGEGSKLDWGRPPTTVDLLVDMGRLAGVHHHYVDDLVATVGAGTPLRAVQAVLSRSGQRLAIDPASAEATIGGVLATGEAGPLRFAHGAPRDQLIGVEFVRSDGVVAHSGGRVVKNVAGYDLGRLLCGSYGTLAFIATATFRLQPVPAATAWVARSVQTPLEVHDLVDELTASLLAPAAIEIDLPQPPPVPAVPRQRTDSLARGTGTLAVLFEGSAAGVQARTRHAARLLGRDSTISGTAPRWWGRYPFGTGDIALKLAVPAADLHATIYALRDALGTAVPVRGSAGVGVCYAALPGTGSDSHVERMAAAIDAVRTTLIARGGSCVVLNAPVPVADALDLWGPVPGLDLMRAVKNQFDPDRMLAPGRFVGGI